MRHLLTLCAAFFIFITPAQAATYKIDYGNSAVTFSGEHAGNTFEGTFHDWNASITFDPEDLKNSHIAATFSTASAKTGDKIYDGTLPEADWFDTKHFQQATFKAEALTATDKENTYNANGFLKIKDIEHPVNFDFTITTDEDTGHTKAEATLILDRILYGIGVNSDPKAEWVSRDIKVKLSIISTPQN